MTNTRLHTSWKMSTPLMHSSSSNDGVIQLGPLSSDAMFEVVEISDACFVHLLLQDASHTVVFQLVWRWVVVILCTPFNSDIRAVNGWYSGLIFLQLSVMTLCASIHDDRLIQKVKWWHWLGAADFCCVCLVLHYLTNIPCKNYNYTFVFVKVILKTLLVPSFSGHSVYPTALWLQHSINESILAVAISTGQVQTCSVGLYIGNNHVFCILEKWLIRSRCCLEWWVRWAQGTMY